MINSIPFFGWFISFVASVSLSLPFWFIWNRLAPIYFYWLPSVYQRIPFWHCVGLFIIIPILRTTLIPTLVNVSNNTKVKKGNQSKYPIGRRVVGG